MNYLKSTTFGLGLAVGAMVLSTQANATAGYFALGYGTNQRALAGAGVAHSHEAMSATINPALAAGVGHQFQLGAELFSPHRGYTGTGTGFVPTGAVDSGSNYFLVPNLSYNRPLDNGGVLNISVYGNGGMNTDYGTGLAGCGSVYCGGPAGVDLSQLFISATYARESGNLSWGIAPTIAMQRFKAEGLGAFAGISMDPTSLTNNGYDYSYGIGLRAGVVWKATPELSFGLSAQTKFNMSKFDKYAGLFADGGDFDIPASVTAGVEWKAGPRTKVMLDFQRIFYSGVGAISNAGNAGALGAPGGAGFGWDDVNVIKLAAEWEASDKMTWRAGYAHATNPVGPEDVTLNIIAPGIVKHHFSVGGTYSFSDRNALDFAVTYVPKSTVSGLEATPGGITPGSNIELNMRQVSVSIGWTHNF